jgi:hypothetical protein
LRNGGGVKHKAENAERFFFCKNTKKSLPQDPLSCYSLPVSNSTTTMILPFPADSAEYEEYVSAMEEMADEAESSTPDPEPPDDSYPYGKYDPYEDYNWRDDR